MKLSIIEHLVSNYLLHNTYLDYILSSKYARVREASDISDDVVGTG